MPGFTIIVLISLAATFGLYAFFCWHDRDFRAGEARYYTFRELGFRRIGRHPVKYLALIGVLLLPWPIAKLFGG